MAEETRRGLLRQRQDALDSGDYERAMHAGRALALLQGGSATDEKTSQLEEEAATWQRIARHTLLLGEWID